MAHAKKVSQAQIARDLDVSQALVSLALNGLKTGINAETYQRIWARASELGYAPKGMHIETALAARRRRQVGFILRSPLRLYTQSNFFSHVQHGLHTTLEAAGYSAVFLGAEDELSPRKLDALLGENQSLTGIVLLGEVDLRFLTRLRPNERPIVAVSASYPGLCHSVNSNEQQSVELLVDHLVGEGHTRIGWLGGNIGLGRHRTRKQALRHALESRGLEVNESFWLDETGADRAEGASAARRLLSGTAREDLPTALVCYNGMMARGAINTLHKNRLSVPDDLSIVAIDRTRVITEESPIITGASADPERMGEMATRLLLENVDAVSGIYSDLVLPAKLIVGDSSRQLVR